MVFSQVHLNQDSHAHLMRWKYEYAYPLLSISFFVEELYNCVDTV